MAWKSKRPADGAMTLEEFQHKARAGDFAPVIALYGHEELLIARAEAFIRKAILGDRVNDFNCELIYCEKGMGERLAEAAATPAFGGGRKVVVARSAQELKDDDHAAIARYAARPLKETCLILAYPGATPWGTGKLTEGRAAFKEALRKHGALVRFDPLERRELEGYIRREAKALGTAVTEEAIALLIEETGDSLAFLLTALEQAVLFAPGRKLDIDAMKAVLINLRGYTIFEFAAALGERNLARAFGMAEHILRSRDELPAAMANLARHFRVLVKVRDMLNRGLTREKIAAATRINDFFLQKEYVPQARNFPAARLSQALSIIAEFDLDVRTSRLDERRALERLMVRLCA